MQMACEYNPPSYSYGDSRFYPYVFTAYQPAELIHRLEPSKITEDTCGAVIVTGNRAFLSDHDQAGKQAHFTLEHRNGR